MHLLCRATLRIPNIEWVLTWTSTGGNLNSKDPIKNYDGHARYRRTRKLHENMENSS